MVQSAIQDEAGQRELDLRKMKNVILKRKFLEKKRSERIQRQKEVAENAATESKDVNEKKWRKLLMVHKFFAFFLKKKMDRELKRFKTVEEAFRTIKSSTGITDPADIIRKYLGREKNYEHLLLSISDGEKKLEILKGEYSQVIEDKKILHEEMQKYDRP